MRPRREGIHVWPAFTDLMSGVALLLLMIGLREADRARQLEANARAAQQRVQALERELAEEQRKYGVQRQVVEQIRAALEARGVAATINAKTGNLEISADMLFPLREYQIGEAQRAGAASIGSAIVQLLEDPELGASIGMLMVVGHTDQRGDTEGNFLLSTQRASELVKLWHSGYKAAAGGNELPRCISAKIVAAAMGESRPLVLAEEQDGEPNPECGNLPHERHGCRRNRRIELRVVPKDAKANDMEGCN